MNACFRPIADIPALGHCQTMLGVLDLAIGMALLCAGPALGIAQEQAEVAARPSLPADKSRTIDAIMLREMEARRIAGASLAIVRDGQVLYASGYGFADLGKRREVTPDTPFMIASMTKMFTATAVMLLVIDGRLSLDHRVSDILPDLPRAWRGVTVRQLLTHTSGIPSFTAFESFPCIPAKAEADYVIGDVLQEVACLPLEFRPGSDFSYSETNYHLLAMIVGRASGRSYEAFLLDRVLRPLSMNDTRFMKRPKEPDDRATGYQIIDDKVQRAPDLYPMIELGLVSNVGDLARFDEALAKGQLLPRHALDQMLTPAGVGSASYGMGFSTRPIDGRRQVGHTGGGPAAATSFARFIDDGITVILLTNTSQPPTSIQTLVDAVADAVLSGRPAVQR